MDLSKTTAAPRQRAARANGVATRARALQVASAAFAKAGYEGTSLRQIATAVGIDLATLKYHFGDKPTLFTEVYRAGQQAFVQAIGPLVESLTRVQTAAELRAQLEMLVDKTYDYLLDNSSFVRITLYRLLEQPSPITEQEARLQGTPSPWSRSRCSICSSEGSCVPSICGGR